MLTIFLSERKSLVVGAWPAEIKSALDTGQRLLGSVANGSKSVCKPSRPGRSRDQIAGENCLCVVDERVQANGRVVENDSCVGRG